MLCDDLPSAHYLHMCGTVKRVQLYATKVPCVVPETVSRCVGQLKQWCVYVNEFSE